MHATSNWVAVHTRSSMHAENTNQLGALLGLVINKSSAATSHYMFSIIFHQTETPLVLYIHVMDDVNKNSWLQFQKYQLLEFLFQRESWEACKLVLSIPEGVVERRTTVHPVCAFTSIRRDCVGCFVGTWKGDYLGSSSRGQPRGALPLHQVTQRQVIKFMDPSRRSGHIYSSHVIHRCVHIIWYQSLRLLVRIILILVG